MKTYIKGNYKKSVFLSNNGYIIGLFKISETNDLELEDFINKTITFTGYFADLNENDTYIMYGEIVEHPKYGFQYQVNESERVKPEDKDGLIEFLSSDLFMGIGIKLATSIVEKLGEHTLDIILENKESLNDIAKITNKKIDIIYNTLKKYEESHTIVVYLTELGFIMKDALNIYNKYKENTILNLDNNIFSLVEDIEDINFPKVDEISRKLNYEKDDERRIKSCIIYIFQNLIFKNGDTYLNYDEIKRSVTNYLKISISSEQFILYIDELRYENKIIEEEKSYSLKDIYDAEEEIISKVKMLLNKNIDNYKNLDKYILELEEETEINYNPKQVEAIRNSLEENILIITGGPGTGKTTIIKSIVDMYMKLNKYNFEEASKKIALLAPTGRASKRMSESTFFPATTIHRFLKWNKDNNKFSVDEFNKDKSELIIIDEVSMIDINLLASLFKGLTDNIKVVLVGDYNQLPSVGPGQILKDLIESEMIKTIELDLLYRQSEESYITELAYEIKNDNLSDNYLDSRLDYTFLKCSSENIKSNLKKLCEKILKKGYDYKRVQILAPMYAGVNGIDSLNKELQQVFNPKSKEKLEINYGDIIFRENDKILQLVNMAEYNVYNGDIGIIKYIIPFNKSESKKNEVYVDYDGLIVKYLPKDFIKIKHGFIVSIHKAQGSEFELVIIPICQSYSRMLYKKLIYTAITRAKSKLIILGEPNAFLYSVKNNSEIPRKTKLKNKLQKMYNN